MLWCIFLLVFVISHLGCMLFGLTRLLTTDQKFITTYLIVGPLLSFAVVTQTGNFIYFLDEGISLGVLAIPVVIYGVFLSVYIAFQVSTTFNKLIRVRVVSKESFLKIYTRALLTVIATFNAIGIPIFVALSWQIMGFSEKLKEQAVSLSQGSEYCIIGLSHKPVPSFDDIKYWKVITEAIAYSLGLPNSVETGSLGWGDVFSRRDEHFAIVLSDKYYYWSFRNQRFIEGKSFSTLTRICSDAGAWRN